MRQESLFDTSDLAGADPSVAPVREALVENAKDHHESSECSAARPLANFSLRETCAYCGHEIDASGCTMPDFEELGCFCCQECADRRFRVYLENEI
jgi:hypothetical protein